MKIIDYKNYGLVIAPPDERAYVLGGGMLPKIVLQPDGQWDEFLTTDEKQFEPDFDTANCSAFGTTNVLEILYRRLFINEANYSDRFLGIVAGTKPPGNDPHTVIEAVRKNGLIDETVLPFDEILLQNVDEYFSFKGANEEDCRSKGQSFLKDISIGHEWVFDKGQDKVSRTEKIKECLKYSPLGVSVTAWIEENGVYIDNGMSNTHWVVLYGWNDRGWKIWDSYEPYKKTLSFDHNIQMCKRYQLKKNKMNITQKMLPISLRRSGQKLLGVDFLVAHDTANPGTTARQNVDYYIRSANEMEASTHYFVDDKEIIQCVPDNEKAWHVRYSTTKDNEIYGKDANSSALGIELCFGGKIDSEKAYQNYIQLLADLCQKYGLNPEKQIVGHYTLDPTRRNDPLNAFKFMNKTWVGFIFNISSLMSNPANPDLVKCEKELEINKTLLQKMWAYIMDILSKR